MSERDRAIKGLRELRNLLTDDEDLKIPIHDEKFLIRFVRGKKYDAAKAHQTVRKYYTLKKKSPKVFKNAYPSYEPVQKILSNNVVMKLKQNDELGRAVIVWNMQKWDTEKYNMDEMTTALVLVVEELLLSSVDVQINGIVVISSCENMGLSHIKEFSPKRLKSILGVVQGSFPLRLKKSVVVKEPAIFDMAMLIVKPFMTEKFKERLVMYGHDLDKLHKIIAADKLPEDYGGTLKDNEAYDDNFRENMIKRDNYYKELLTYGFGEWDDDEEDTYM